MITKLDIKAAREYAKGSPPREVARKLGISARAASSKIKKPELRSLLEHIQKRTIERSAQLAADNIIHVISTYKDNNCSSNKKRIEKTHGFRASERIAESIGVFPSRVESPVVLQILNQGNLVISPEIVQILSGLKRGLEVPELGLGESVDISGENS